MTDVAATGTKAATPAHDQPKRRWWVAGLLSLLAPGLGHAYGGRLARGIFVYAGFAFFYVAWLALLLHVSGPVAWCAGAALTLGWFLFLLIDAARLARRPPRRHRRRYQRWWGLILLFAAAKVLTGASTGLLRFTWIALFSLPTGSMMDTLLPGDQVVVDRFRYWVHDVDRGDVVDFADPENGVALMKRVVGLPGDTVEVRDGRLILNGSTVEEPFIRIGESSNPYADHEAEEVPPAHVFVLGDNRLTSRDSRHFGPVPISSVKGRVATVYWSVVPQYTRSPSPGSPGLSSDRDRFVRWERLGLRVE